MSKRFNLKDNKWYFQSLRNTKSVKVVDNDWKEAVEIEWYASTKDKDRVWDIVEPKAFEKAIEWYMLNPIVLLQHKTDKPIWLVEETNIDDNWLFIKAKITENTDWVIDQIKNWVLRSFSIWYRVKDYDTDVRELADWTYDMTNIIKDLELFEISVVSVPANPYALVKSLEDKLEVIEEDEEEVEPDKVSEVMEHEITESQDTNENEQNENNDNWEVEEQWEDKVEEEVESETVVEEEKEFDTSLMEDDILKEIEEITADENSEIVETEVEEVSENEVETPTNDEVADETSSDEVVETKSIEVETKSFNFDEKFEQMQKSFDEQLNKKDIEIKELKSKVDTMSKLFAESVETIDRLATKINNIPVAKWLAYTRPVKKQWYSAVAEALKNF